MPGETMAVATKPTFKRLRPDPNIHYPSIHTGPLPTSNPPSLSTHQRIFLIWAKLTSVLFRSLSFNILREVSSYISSIPKIVNLRNRKVIAIGVLEKEWAGLYEVGLEISGFYCSLPLEEDRLFIGLIEYRKLPHYANPKACFHIYQNNTPWKLGYREITIWNSGLIYDFHSCEVYFFGGTDTRGSGVNRAIKLSIKTQIWTDIPGEMNCFRHDFNPCWYQQLVYLCSGSNSRVETFDPSNSHFLIFEPFALSAVTDRSLSLSAVIDDELVVLTNNTVFGYHFRTGKVRKNTQLVPNIQLKSPPLVYCGTIYCVDCGRNEMWHLRPFLISESHRLEYFF